MRATSCGTVVLLRARRDVLVERAMRATSCGTVVLLRARRDVLVGARHARDL